MILSAAVARTVVTAIGKKITVMVMRIKRTSGYESGCITMILLNLFNLDFLLRVPNPAKCDVINDVNHNSDRLSRIYMYSCKFLTVYPIRRPVTFASVLE